MDQRTHSTTFLLLVACLFSSTYAIVGGPGAQSMTGPAVPNPSVGASPMNSMGGGATRTMSSQNPFSQMNPQMMQMIYQILQMLMRNPAMINMLMGSRSPMMQQAPGRQMGAYPGYSPYNPQPGYMSPAYGYHYGANDMYKEVRMVQILKNPMIKFPYQQDPLISQFVRTNGAMGASDILKDRINTVLRTRPDLYNQRTQGPLMELQRYL